MIIAVIAVRMMQMTVDQIVDVIAMRYSLVSAAWAMLMPGLVPHAAMLRRTPVGILTRHFDHMLIDVIAVHVMQVAVVQVIDMIAVLDGLVAAARSVLVRVICVMRIRTRRHRRLPMRVIERWHRFYGSCAALTSRVVLDGQCRAQRTNSVSPIRRGERLRQAAELLP
ncbi:protein of unknown function [Hyphomicrobium sp. 1Nfss2.1]